MDRKKLYIWGALAFVILAFAIVFTFGWYPVAVVNGTPILAQTWKRVLGAEQRIVNVHAYASGVSLIDFASPKNADKLRLIQAETLMFLIDDILMKKEGSVLVPQLGELSEGRVRDALQKKPVSDQAAQSVYGVDLGTMREIILFPQARHEVVRETLEKQDRDFEEWLRKTRASANVRLLFVPFQWRDGSVR